MQQQTLHLLFSVSFGFGLEGNKLNGACVMSPPSPAFLWACKWKTVYVNQAVQYSARLPYCKGCNGHLMVYVITSLSFGSADSC
jgi:hypothetical protein